MGFQSSVLGFRWVGVA